MPFRRTFSKRPINSTKHVLDFEGGLTSTKSVNTVLLGVPSRKDPFVPGDVPFGSRVSSVFISLFIIGATGAPVTGSQNWYIAKLRSGQTSGNFPDPGVTGVSTVRNQIFHEEKGLVGSGDGTAMAFKGVIKIPKSMQRVREGDQLHVAILNNSADSATFCLKVIYKSYE